MNDYDVLKTALEALRFTVYGTAGRNTYEQMDAYETSMFRIARAMDALNDGNYSVSFTLGENA